MAELRYLLSKNWQQQLAESFTSIESLCHYLQLDYKDLPISLKAGEQFSLRVPLNFASCIQKGNPNDPLLRQILPIKAETKNYVGFSNDPVGDLAASKGDGILHKYHGRILMINTGSCAINCRYCFRRNFPYADLQLTKQKEDAAIAYILKNKTINEIILSGGDPLLLSNVRLKRLIQRINEIHQIKRLRIHTRLPIVLPARITDEFIETLQFSQAKVVVVVHCNHPNEINSYVTEACFKLARSGVILLNQSVLLKGVNDNLETLCLLSEKLFENHVLPYYLHNLDKANGVGHFEVPEKRALTLAKQMQSRLSGYLVPKLVKEQAGASSKSYIF